MHTLGLYSRLSMVDLPHHKLSVSETAAGDAKHSLESLRRRIDQLDKQLVRVLSERAQVVVEIGKAKRGSGTPIYAPHREQQVIANALANNPGPLPARTV